MPQSPLDRAKKAENPNRSPNPLMLKPVASLAAAVAATAPAALETEMETPTLNWAKTVNRNAAAAVAVVAVAVNEMNNNNNSNLIRRHNRAVVAVEVLAPVKVVLAGAEINNKIVVVAVDISSSSRKVDVGSSVDNARLTRAK